MINQDYLRFSLLKVMLRAVKQKTVSDNVQSVSYDLEGHKLTLLVCLDHEPIEDEENVFNLLLEEVIKDYRDINESEITFQIDSSEKGENSLKTVVFTRGKYLQ